MRREQLCLHPDNNGECGSNHFSSRRNSGLTSIWPGLTSTAITVTGTGFTGATAVTVGGTAVTNLVVVSDTEITATTPASSIAGQVDILVTTPDGTSTSVAGDKYTFAATATTIPLPIFSASPTSGSAPLEVIFLDASTVPRDDGVGTLGMAIPALWKIPPIPT